MATLISIIAILLIIPIQKVEASTGSLGMEQSFVSPNSADLFTINNSDTYNVTFDITSVDITSPIIVINVPIRIEISYYPTASNTTLAPILISSGAVTSQLDETTYAVSASYYDGEIIISSRSKTVTKTNNPTLKPNIMYMSNGLNLFSMMRLATIMSYAMGTFIILHKEQITTHMTMWNNCIFSYIL